MYLSLNFDYKYEFDSEMSWRVSDALTPRHQENMFLQMYF